MFWETASPSKIGHVVIMTIENNLFWSFKWIIFKWEFETWIAQFDIKHSQRWEINICMNRCFINRINVMHINSTIRRVRKYKLSIIWVIFSPKVITVPTFYSKVMVFQRIHNNRCSIFISSWPHITGLTRTLRGHESCFDQMLKD